jgi:hypothetical protein
VKIIGRSSKVIRRLRDGNVIGGVMSNYSLQGKNPNHKVFVGWDPMLNTFFLHIIDQSKDEDDGGREIVDIGATFGEIRDVDALEEKAKEYVEFTGELWADLRADSMGEQQQD